MQILQSSHKCQQINTQSIVFEPCDTGFPIFFYKPQVDSIICACLSIPFNIKMLGFGLVWVSLDF